MPVRLTDVAARAGVAPSTASLALKNGPHVSPEVRERVLAAVRELRFDLTRLRGGAALVEVETVAAVTSTGPARSDLQGITSKSERHTVAFVWPGRYPVEHHAYYAPLVAGVRRAARDLGPDLLLVPAASHEVESVVSVLLDDAVNPVAGTLLMGVQDDSALRWLARWDKPAGFLGRQLQEEAARHCSSVSVDQRAGLRLAVEHLMARGHRRIAYAGLGQRGKSVSAQRVAGYREALEAGGLPLADSLVFPIVWRDATAADRIGDGIRAGEVTAVACATDALALRLRRRLAEHGLLAPRDYALTGFNDTHEAPAEGLTSVGWASEHAGELGLRLLWSLLNDPAIGRQHVILRPVLHARVSSDLGASTTHSPEFPASPTVLKAPVLSTSKEHAHQ